MNHSREDSLNDLLLECLKSTEKNGDTWSLSVSLMQMAPCENVHIKIKEVRERHASEWRFQGFRKLMSDESGALFPRK